MLLTYPLGDIVHVIDKVRERRFGVQGRQFCQKGVLLVGREAGVQLIQGNAGASIWSVVRLSKTGRTM